MRFAIADEHRLQWCTQPIFCTAIIEYIISSDPITLGWLFWQMSNYWWCQTTSTEKKNSQFNIFFSIGYEISNKTLKNQQSRTIFDSMAVLCQQGSAMWFDRNSPNADSVHSPSMCECSSIGPMLDWTSAMWWMQPHVILVVQNDFRKWAKTFHNSRAVHSNWIAQRRTL